MILSANEIRQRISVGEIKIQDFDEARLGPNSYNLRLDEDLMVYKEAVLDPRQDNRTNIVHIPAEGMVLQPGQLYLASTMEYTETHGLVPMIVGRSSVGRLGLFVHVTAGFGDIGFSGRWTLELTPVRPSVCILGWNCARCISKRSAVKSCRPTTENTRRLRALWQAACTRRRTSGRNQPKPTPTLCARWTRTPWRRSWAAVPVPRTCRRMSAWMTARETAANAGGGGWICPPGSSDAPRDGKPAGGSTPAGCPGKGTEWLRHETGANCPGNLVGTAALAVRRCAVSARRPAREQIHKDGHKRLMLAAPRRSKK